MRVGGLRGTQLCMALLHLLCPQGLTLLQFLCLLARRQQAPALAVLHQKILAGGNCVPWIFDARPLPSSAQHDDSISNIIDAYIKLYLVSAIHNPYHTVGPLEVIPLIGAYRRLPPHVPRMPAVRWCCHHFLFSISVLSLTAISATQRQEVHTPP